MVPQPILNRWDGAHWALWTLLAGCLLALATLASAALVALLFDQDVTAFMMLLLMGELLVLSTFGSGLLDGMSRRMSRGGLARETADLDERFANDPAYKERTEAEQRRRDRRTVRAGLLTLPLLLTFGYLLFFG
jgi:hypothetical protein